MWLPRCSASCTGSCPPPTSNHSNPISTPSAETSPIAKIRKAKTEASKLADLKVMQNSDDLFMESDSLAALIDNAPSMDSVIEKAVQELGGATAAMCAPFFLRKQELQRKSPFSQVTLKKQVKSYLQNGKRNLRLMLKDELKRLTA